MDNVLNVLTWERTNMPSAKATAALVKSANSTVESIKKGLRKKKKQSEKKQLLLSTGSTLLNLACSGDPMGGFIAGGYHLLVGDSISGKTFLSLTCLAEASINPAFDEYRFIYDEVEGGALMDFAKFFGQDVADRVEAPNEDGTPSETIESFYYGMDNALKEDKPFIWILDSMDGLTSEPEVKKFDEQKKAYENNKVISGSYGDGKAKINSSHLRKLMGPLQASGSILIIISQTRDNVGGGMFEPKKIRSGGKALRFYATFELWSSLGKNIIKQIRGKPRQLGVISKITIKKNRLTGRERSVELPILHAYGLDNTTSCIEYLVDEGHWKKDKKGVITVVDMGLEFTGRIEKVAIMVEEKGLIGDLCKLVGRVWNEIEAACETKRVKRY